MTCVQQNNPYYACKAKAWVIKEMDGRFHMEKELDNHSHDPNKALIIAQGLKLKMVEIVKKNPSAPVGKAIKAVKQEILEKYGQNDKEFKDIMVELGTDHSLELRLQRAKYSAVKYQSDKMLHAETNYPSETNDANNYLKDTPF